MAYEQAITLDPYNATTHINKANLLYDLNRCGEALVAYERTTALDPGSSSA